MKIEHIRISLENGMVMDITLHEARQLLAELKALLDPPRAEPIPWYPGTIQPWYPPSIPGDGTGTWPGNKTYITWCTAGDTKTEGKAE